MKITSLIGDSYEFVKRRIYLISWISLVLYLFYDTFIYFKYGRQFYYLRKILGLGLCVSRGTATVINLCCALVLLPICKKLNQVLYRALSKLCPGLFFFWLERAKSFHMTVAVTLLIFAVIHSISHLVNLWNFSRGYDEHRAEINFANHRNENPFILLMSMAGVTGVSMLVIILCMGLTSLRAVRRRMYNAFWYTHQLYLLFIVLLIIHPLSGVLKEEIIDNETSLFPSQIVNWTISDPVNTPKFAPIKSKTWLWVSVPLTCFCLDFVWRIFSRNRARVNIRKVVHMAGGTMSLTVTCPELQCRIGQYVLLQCLHVSLIEWHPFTVVKVPTSYQRNFVVWIRVKGDWTEALERLLIERGPSELSVLVDGPFSSPMESVCRSEVAICVAAGVGITPFVALLDDMFLNPRRQYPGRIHLLWIVRYERELTWLAGLANKTISHLRNANRPDRLHVEFYVTNRNELKNDSHKADNPLIHSVVVNEKGVTQVLRDRDDERVSLLTPKRSKRFEEEDNNFNIAKEYPVLGCRVKRGRPHWDRVFGYWVHLYPETHLNLYCCGPKKLVKLLKSECKHASKTTKTKFTFVHEGFS